MTDKDSLKLVLITSNIGSLFDGDKASELREFWLSQIIKEINSSSAIFVGIHLQESGGKNYKHHSGEMRVLVNSLCKRLAPTYSTYRGFLDLEFERIELYTALSSLYFVHRNYVRSVRQYNFRRKDFISSDKPFITEELSNTGFAVKEKYSRDFFPAIRWGRKGFLHTRWRIGSRIFDLINLHLFHDESNLATMENPNVYRLIRKNALDYTLGRFKQFNANSMEGESHLFIFGDFNFRLNSASFIKKLIDATTSTRVINGALTEINTRFLNVSQDETSGCSGESSSEWDANTTSSQDGPIEANARRRSTILEFFNEKNPDNGYILRIGKKSFELIEPKKLVDEWSSFRSDDTEISYFPTLHEMPISFPPTYPWSENPEKHQYFMGTRAPAWCDRILMNENVWKNLISNASSSSYMSFGFDACIGDHKPVKLCFTLPNDI